MERINYPFKPRNTGIDFEKVFENFAKGENQGEITSGSGMRLLYTIKKDSLLINDLTFLDRFMYANVKNNVARFSIQTKTSPLDIISREFPWQRHPDMYATKFVGVALKHFRDNGVDVVACMGQWQPESDNYISYIQKFRADGDKVGAAKATSSGRVFISFGYSEIKLGDIEHTESESASPVRAFFHRPAR